MKNLLKIAFVIFLLVLIYSCENEDVVVDSEDIPVVEAYLIPGMPINKIKLTKLIPYSTEEEDIILETINDADIYILSEGNEFLLSSMPGDSGYYYYPDNTVIIEANKEYSIEFDYNNKLVSATTFSPKGLRPSHSALSVDESHIWLLRV